MNSIFKTLFNLKLKSSNQPFEDYLTEIFAFCLLTNLDLLSDFLITFGIHISKYELSNISTQFYIKALNNHESDSKPDLAIFLDCKTIFIESKVASQEGHKQLKRYAEHLDKYSTEKVLIYITRDFDPKDKEYILKDCQNAISFVQIRWHQVYRLLKKHSSSEIINQLIKYMSENGLSVNNQFSPIDILTLNNFSRVRKMLDDTLFSEVSANFKATAGGLCQQSAMLTQVRNHNRYIYYADQKDGMWVGLGYWLNPVNKQYPDLKLIIEVSPSSAQRKTIIDSFKTIKENDKEWISSGLNNPSSWASIQIICNLQEFLSKEDHVKEIKAFFMKAIDQLKCVKTNYPQLPWL